MSLASQRRLSEFKNRRLTRSQLVGGFSRLKQVESDALVNALVADSELRRELVGPDRVSDVVYAPKGLLGPQLELKDELAWFVAGLRISNDLVDNAFAAIGKFHTAVAAGRFAEADVLLASAHNEFGYSLFVEANMLRLGTLRGARLADYESPKTLIEFLAHLYRARFEPSEPVQKFRDRLEATKASGNVPLKAREPVSAFFDFVVGIDEPVEVTDDDVAFILRQMVHFPLIDRIDLFVRLACILVERPEPWAKALVQRLVKRFGMDSADPRVAALEKLRMASAISLNAHVPLLEHVELYTVGDYQSVLGKAQALKSVDRTPELVELVWRSCRRLGEDPSKEFVDSSVFGRLMRIVQLNDKGGDDSLDAENSLGKLLLQLKDTVLWYKIRALTPDLLRTEAQKPRPKDIILGQVTLTPRTIARLRDIGFEVQQHDISTVSPVASTLFGSDDIALVVQQLPPARREKYLGIRAEQTGDAMRALGHFHAQLELESDVVGQGSALKGVVRQHLAMEDHLGASLACVEWAVKGVKLDRETANLVYQRGASSPGLHRSLISWPVLVEITVGRIPRQAAQNPIYRALADLIDYREVLRPSDLLRQEFKDVTVNDTILAYFCEHVCVLDNITSLVGITSSRELLQERSRLLEEAIRLDPSAFERCSGELSDIQQSLHTQELVSRADRGRVVVEVEGMRARVGRETRTLCISYLGLATLDDGIELFIFQLGSQNSPLKRVEYRTYQRLLSRILTELRDVFVADPEVGVDSYLSVQIRHGSLVEQLRGPFERHLVGRGAILSASSSLGDQRGALSVEARRISVELSGALERVKANWIQPRLKEADPIEHLFDFVIRDSDIESVHASVASRGLSTEELIDELFEYLRARLERNLESVRGRLDLELRRSLHEIVDNAAFRLGGVVGDERRAELLKAVDDCQLGVDRSIEIVKTWFNLEETSAKKAFSLDAAVRAAVTCAERLSHDRSVCYRICECPIVSVSGRYFRPVFYVLQIVLDNVAKHSKSDVPRADISVDVQEGRVTIAVESDGVSDDDYASIISQTETQSGQQALTRMRREGKSGYPKLVGIVSRDFTEGTLAVQRSGEGRLKVSLGFKL